MTFSKRLIVSYAADWLVLVAIALIAYGFSRLTPHYHAFSVLDLSISYPLVKDTVSYWLVGVVAGVVPAVIVAVLSLLLPSSPHGSKASSSSTGSQPHHTSTLGRRLWALHASLLGLALSLATAILITQGLKNFGKPRPNALARCQPDLANLDAYVVSGSYGTDISPRWTLVTHDICLQPDPALLKDAFQSWPSGHSSTSTSGLVYLTLFLAARLGAVVPVVPFGEMIRDPRRARRSAAAAPVYVLLLALVVPLGAAAYICLSRYMDYAHHGFDILSGAVIGIVCAFLAFRWYHLPLEGGAGWSWGPRSGNRAFWGGFGTGRWVGREEVGDEVLKRMDEASNERAPRDVEAGMLSNSGSESRNGTIQGKRFINTSDI